MLVRYTRSVFISALAILGLAGFYNYHHDPYAVFHRFENAQIIGVGRYVSEVKWKWFEANEPTTIILGTSRAEIGFNPDSVSQLLTNDTVFNFATPGQSILETRLILEHAILKGNIKNIILPLDYFAFNNQRILQDITGKIKNNRHLKFLLNDEASTSLQLFRSDVEDLQAKIFSFRALADSLALQKVDLPITCESEVTPKLGLDSPRNSWKQNGQRWEFWPRCGEYSADLMFRKVLRSFDRNKRRYNNINPTHNDTDKLEFGKILKLVQQHKINAFIFFSPSHASLLALLTKGDRWDHYVNWKVRLAEAINEHNSLLQKPLPLWDFFYPNAITVEPWQNQQKMNWYWDPSHFKEGVGNLVLAKVSATCSSTIRCENNFGRRLKLDNIQQILNEDLNWLTRNIKLSEYAHAD